LVGEVVLVKVGSRGVVKGRASRAKTSPERRMGTRVPKVEVRSSSASRLIGVLEGVERVRGWMVSQSMCRSWSGPRTVVMKSIVLLRVVSWGFLFAPE
jgi:hypothetical protein